MNPNKCFKCQGVGNISKYCPTKGALVFCEDLNGWYGREEEDYHDDFNEREKEYDEYTLEEGKNATSPDPLDGEVLVIVRSLNTQVLDEDLNIQRENIFHTKCQVEGKIANLIVDCSSCTNVASNDLLENINLPLLKDLKPYKLQWLNDYGEAKVNKQVWVPISMGFYTDKVL